MTKKEILNLLETEYLSGNIDNINFIVGEGT